MTALAADSSDSAGSEPELPVAIKDGSAVAASPAVSRKRKKKKKKKVKAQLPSKISRRRLDEHAAQGETPSEQQPEDATPAGRPWTVSVALPGSFIANCQSFELRTYVAGEIARALTIFNVDEIVVFEENNTGDTAGIDGMKTNPTAFLARILQYQDCPPYLRKKLLPMHRDLRFAGLLNPVIGPHHLKREDESPYREGVVLKRPTKAGQGAFVDIGLYKECKISHSLEAGTRVTVKLDTTQYCLPKVKNYLGDAVAPSEPRAKAGLYWGYSVRIAESLSKVFTQCPFEGGYDCTVGTSERGEPVEGCTLPKFNHLLLVLGGVHGLEASLESDEALTAKEPSELFDFYLNTCPGQGSGTIRTEEALLITLSALRPRIASSGAGPAT